MGANGPIDEWWREHFSGMLADLWRSIVPPEETASAVDFAVHACRVTPGAAILDIPCGEGRVTLELARRGFRMHGLDISEDLLSTARARAEAGNLPIEWIRGDMREIAGPPRFDAACCLGDSFGYMDDDSNAAFLAAVHGVLKPGGRFALEMKMLAEVLFPRFHERLAGSGSGIAAELIRHYDPLSGRMNVEYRLERGGQREVRHASYRIYTCSEVCRMLEAAGFGGIELHDAAGADFALGSERLRLSAEAGRGR